MPTYEITLGNGSVYEVDGPDNATEQDLMGAVAGQMDPQDLSVARSKNDAFGEFLRTQAKQPREGETAEDRSKRLYGSSGYEREEIGAGQGMARAAVQGLTFGAGDEIVAGGAAGLETLFHGGKFGDNYQAYLDKERGRIDRFRDESPVMAYGSEIAGAVPTAMMPMGQLGRVAQSGSLGARVAAGGAIGAGQGAAYGFNAGEGGFGNRVRDAGTGGVVGGGFGMAAPVVAQGAKNLASLLLKKGAEKAVVKNAPTTQELKRIAGAAYDRADNTGVQFAPDSFGVEVASLSQRLTKEGLDPTLHPKATAILNRLSEQEAPSPTILRRLVSGVQKSTDPDERRLGGIMTDAVDDYIARLGPDDVLSGNPAGLADDMKTGRVNWRRAKGSEMIDDVFTKADLQASGVENGLRIQARQILMNPKIRRTLGPEEVEALELVVKGTPVSNVLKKLSKLGPGSGQQSNMLMGFLSSGAGAGAGASVGGPLGGAIGATVLPAIGYGAQKGAEAITAGNARLARALMAQGGLGSVPTPNPQIQRLTQMLLQRNAPVTAPAVNAYQYK